MNVSRLRPRRGRVLAVGGITTAALLLTACSGTSTSSTTESNAASETRVAESASATASAQCEPSAEIPAVTLPFSLSPYGDMTVPVIGSSKGYFENVGITIDPAPNGAKLDLIGSGAPLLSGQVSAGTGFPPIYLAQLDSVKELTAFALSDLFTGYTILGPEGSVTVDELLAQGLTLDEAMKEALAPIKGKSIALMQGDPVASLFFEIVFGLAGITADDADTTFAGSAEITKAAQAGRLDFAAPTGGVDIQTLIGDGWEKIVDVKTLYENFEALGDPRLQLLVSHTGWLTTKDFAAENRDTLLRLTSVMYRIIDDIQNDPSAVIPGAYLDFTNAYTGASLSPEAAEGLFTSVYAPINFDEAARLYTETGAADNIETAYGAQLAEYKERGVVNGDYAVSDLYMAGDIWRELKEYRDKSDVLFEELSGQSVPQLEAARAQYDARNYLDAYRILSSIC